jgi:hypothetical protein
MCMTYDRGRCGIARPSDDFGWFVRNSLLAGTIGGVVYLAATNSAAIVEALQRAALWASVALVSPLVGYLIGTLTARFDLLNRARAAAQAAIVRRRLRRLLKAEVPALGPARPLALPAATETPFTGIVSIPNERRNPVCQTP